MYNKTHDKQEPPNFLGSLQRPTKPPILSVILCGLDEPKLRGFMSPHCQRNLLVTLSLEKVSLTNGKSFLFCI